MPRRLRLAFAVLAPFAVVALAAAPVRLGAGLQGLKSGFGGAVGLSGNSAMIGSSFEAFPSSGHHGYVYVQDQGGAWNEEAALVPSGNIYAYFTPAALRGDSAAIGSVKAIGQALVGSVQTFSRTGTTWSSGTALSRSNGVAGDDFGACVAFSADGSTLFSGAPRAGSGPNYLPGAVWVHVETGLGWQETDTLVPDDGAAFDQFGASIASAGDYVVIGSKNHGNRGNAYLYQLLGQPATWQLVHKFEDGGWRVAISGAGAGPATVVVGDPDDATNGESSGAARVYTGSGSTWTLQTTLFAETPEAHDLFGTAVAIHNTRAVVGAPHEFGSATRVGEAFAFGFAAGAWGPPDRLVSPDANAEKGFGRAVAVEGNTALVSSGGSDAPNTPGAVFAFDLAGGGGGGGASVPPLRPSANPAVVGIDVTFDVLAVRAAPAKPAALVYHWDFGDGTTLDAGSRVTHRFGAAGNFSVKARAEGAAEDSGRFTVSLLAPGTPYFDVAKASFGLRFDTQGKDKIAFSGTLPIANGTPLAGKVVSIDFGGVTQQFTLDAKGKSPKGPLSVKVSPPKNGAAKFTVKMAGSFAATLADEGATNATVANVDATTHVEVTFDGQTYAEDFVLVYAATAGKSGAAK